MSVEAGDFGAVSKLWHRLRRIEPALTVSAAIRSARFANPDKTTELRDALLLTGLPK